MEILDYLRAARRRLWLIIAVPLVAMAVAGGLVMLKPTTYSADATVEGPVFVGATSRFAGSQGSNVYVSTFQSTATSPGLLAGVAEATGTSTKALNDGLVVARVGASTSMQVSYTARSRDQVEPVLREVTSQALTRIFTSQVDASLARVEVAQEAVATANEAIAEFGTRTGVADPERSYEAQLNQVNALVQQEANLRANGNTLGAAALAGTITKAREQLATYTPLLAEYGNLVIDRDAAATGLNDAQASLEQSRAQVTAADPGTIVFVPPTTQDSKTGPLLQTVLPVGAAALFLAVLLAAALETLARARGAAPVKAGAPARGGDARQPRVIGLWPARGRKGTAPEPEPAGARPAGAGSAPGRGPAPKKVGPEAPHTSPSPSKAPAPSTAARNGSGPTRPAAPPQTRPAPAPASRTSSPRPGPGASRPSGAPSGAPTGAPNGSPVKTPAPARKGDPRR